MSNVHNAQTPYGPFPVFSRYFPIVAFDVALLPLTRESQPYFLSFFPKKSCDCFRFVERLALHTLYYIYGKKRIKHNMNVKAQFSIENSISISTLTKSLKETQVRR